MSFGVSDILATRAPPEIRWNIVEAITIVVESFGAGRWRTVKCSVHKRVSLHRPQSICAILQHINNPVAVNHALYFADHSRGPPAAH